MFIFFEGAPPPRGQNPQGARRVYRRADLIFSCFILPDFCISFSLSFAFASVPVRFLLNNRYPARGVPAGYTAGLPAPFSFFVCLPPLSLSLGISGFARTTIHRAIHLPPMTMTRARTPHPEHCQSYNASNKPSVGVQMVLYAPF